MTTFDNKLRKAVVCSFSSLRASLSVFMLSFMICRSDSLVSSCCFKSLLNVAFTSRCALSIFVCFLFLFAAGRILEPARLVVVVLLSRVVALAEAVVVAEGVLVVLLSRVVALAEAEVVALLSGAVALAEAVLVVLLSGAVALVEAVVVVLLPWSVVLTRCPSSPLSTLWSRSAPEVSLPMDAGVSGRESHPISSRPTGFTDGRFLISR